ncbi:MAG: LysM peptidoglycan-binding domain-containing protein [Lutibacter sp.]|nr:LysM peptidoglycan-binding domain-containing protein [Lutibacter sp.]MDT8418383.1 LysM peptidoglycan-binding domain-containing protein [Lutibacter sp.]
MKRITLLLVSLILFSCITLAQQKKYVSYTVKKGETVKSIAKAYHLTSRDLLQLNPDISRNLEPNTVIIVPNLNYGKENTRVQEVKAAHNDKKTYDVLSKDTLYGISKKFGITVDELLAANPQLKDGLKPGMKLEIPESGAIKINDVVQYEFHIVVKDDTLYNLSKRYHITQEELIRLNPSLKDGLKIGMELVLPKIGDSNAEVVDNYEYHTVVKDDTLYNLSKRYQISQAELLRLNPELSEGLKLGMNLKMKPLQNWKNQITLANENQFASNKVIFNENFDTSKEINLVVMLPYHVNKASDSTKTENFGKSNSLLNYVTDFHLGAMMAIDSLRNQGLNIKVKFIDSENSTQKLQTVINRNELKNVDAVIGPLYFDNAYWLSKHIDAPIVVPFYSKNQSDNSANNLVKASPGDELLQSELLRYLEKKYNGENIVVINDGKSGSQTKLWQVVNRLKTFNNVKNISVVKSELGYVSGEKFSDKLTKTVNNWVILVSDEMVTTASAVNSLKSLAHNFNITLIALDKGTNFGSVDNNLLGQLNFIYPSIDFLDVDDVNVNNFYKNYQDINYAIPSKYALKGFDITYDVLARIATMDTLEQGLMAGKSSRLSTLFKYDRNLMGSFENRGVFIIQYNKSLTPIILE